MSLACTQPGPQRVGSNGLLKLGPADVYNFDLPHRAPPPYNISRSRCIDDVLQRDMSLSNALYQACQKSKDLLNGFRNKFQKSPRCVNA